MYVWCMYVCMYVCVCMYIYVWHCMYAGMHVRMHACSYVWEKNVPTDRPWFFQACDPKQYINLVWPKCHSLCGLSWNFDQMDIWVVAWENDPLGEKIFLVENVERQKWLPRREEERGESPSSPFLGSLFWRFLDFLWKSVFHPKGRFLMQRLIQWLLSKSRTCKSRTPSKSRTFWPGQNDVMWRYGIATVSACLRWKSIFFLAQMCHSCDKMQRNHVYIVQSMISAYSSKSRTDRLRDLERSHCIMSGFAWKFFTCTNTCTYTSTCGHKTDVFTNESTKYNAHVHVDHTPVTTYTILQTGNKIYMYMLHVYNITVSSR